LDKKNYLLKSKNGPLHQSTFLLLALNFIKKFYFNIRDSPEFCLAIDQLLFLRKREDHHRKGGDITLKLFLPSKV